MVADAFAIATRIKAIRDRGDVFLNDGLYGGLAEARDMAMVDRIEVMWPDGSREGFPGGPADRLVVLYRGGGSSITEARPRPSRIVRSMKKGSPVVTNHEASVTALVILRFSR